MWKTIKQMCLCIYTQQPHNHTDLSLLSSKIGLNLLPYHGVYSDLVAIGVCNRDVRCSSLDIPSTSEGCFERKMYQFLATLLTIQTIFSQYLGVHKVTLLAISRNGYIYIAKLIKIQLLTNGFLHQIN